ncbi:hypothetical protein ABT275_39575 [Streptomyces sp. NPDC001185]|uniref:hypothetical protein n=1 Tax=Streptomyces sp. NPDC001185 TaxID=3154380 RepID=UPI0033223B4D
MSQRKFRGRATAAAAVTATLLALTGANSSTASAATAGTREARNCVIVLDRLQPGETSSRVLSRTCTTDTGSAQAQPSSIQSTLLMTWYADANQSGASTQIRGSSGGCDASGYGIAYVGDDWNDRISSYKLFGTCNTVDAYDTSNYGNEIYFCGICSADNIPWSANDRISSMWIKHW